ncbi:hypothetical protein NHX12_033516 [Muraenolepis orangiensis]|uniref:RGS domain-containing protein n=1 Tax=Muraenolepis orangiensis TaxID=630683 RepID=A0A9Q0E2H9_9TELE|nr:hypothetical protein NHX12_033516 [Muraenolepis orangiensis]
MPKLLFSKIRIYEFKDLIQNAKQPRRIDILLSSRRRKSLDSFRAFLCSEFSEENLDFWLACQAFRQTTSPAERSWKAEQIYQEFLQPNAQREVNVDHCTRERIQGSLAQQRPLARCFDEAQRNIYLLMERDPWPRFLHSRAYHGLRPKTSTVWYI